MKKLRYIYLFVGVLGVLVAQGQAKFSVQATLDSNAIMIGEQVKLHLTIYQGNKTNVEDANVSVVGEVENLEVVDVSEWDTLMNSPQLVIQKDLTLTSFDSGYYYIPPIPVIYSEFGLKRNAETKKLALAVNTVPLVDTLQIAPIKDIIQEPLNLWDYLKPIGGILLFGLLFFAAWYFWTHRKEETKDEVVIPEVIRPAHEIALEQLSGLGGQQLWQQGKIKEYQSRLTHIVREYLENRYKVNALESTTDQILKDLKKVDFDSTWKDKLREMLQQADLVKFAKAEPPADFHQRMFVNAEEFVRTTKRIEVVDKTREED